MLDFITKHYMSVYIVVSSISVLAVICLWISVIYCVYNKKKET